MYITRIELENFRTFRQSEITFCHADLDFASAGMPRPRYPNLNLLLANNGFGKTSLLRAIALTALGPAVGHAGIFPYHLVRREPGKLQQKMAKLRATFATHEQDHAPHLSIDSAVNVSLEGDLEILEYALPDPKLWHPVFSSSSDAFFVVGYGSTRRVAKTNRTEQSGRTSVRASRIMGLFEDDYTLRPMNVWLPRYESSAQLRGRYVQVVNLLKNLVGKDGWQFTGKLDSNGEFLFRKEQLEIPFPALSDGYRAFLGWVGDMLYHVCETCPSGKKLVENRGIVMVDEVDLHLHPVWQIRVLQSLAEALPNIQFIVTSHSPLVVGSLEWMNIVLMEPGPKQSSRARRIEKAVHGLDADQVLTTEFFGMQSTRAAGVNRDLKEIALQARLGDADAALDLLHRMSSGAERGK